MEAIQKRVTKIERASVAQGENQIRPLAKLRVAAYARVSTDSDEQFTSFEAQVDYYTRQINANADWTMIEVYTDEGISGTNTKKRDGFNRMIADALAGKIDLIITKSISRFARNTVDTLTSVRQLKEKGVEVFFEKENIYTMDSKGELLITIMSSLAQEESRSISENVAWGKRAKCEEGKVYLPYKQFLGYEKGSDGLPQIVEEQAKTVRLIYSLFLEGLMPSGIAKRLEAMGIPSPAGKQRWQTSTVESILKNEKYKGDALLQKTFCVDFLTKKMKRNEGELPQYYVEQSHPAIVSSEVYDEVQQELKRRREVRYVGRSGCFSSKIICGECGSYFGRKVWHSNNKYRTVIWRCQHKYDNGEPCKTPHVTEDQIKAAFVAEMNRMIANKDQVLTDIRTLISTLTDTRELEERETAAVKELEAVSEMMRILVDDYARARVEQKVYDDRYAELLAQSQALEEQIAEIGEQREQRRARKRELDAFYKMLKTMGPIIEFDEELWNFAVEKLKVHVDGQITFAFRTG
ncbi:MAG TPA: recombinase family protein [Negativicutes bacterium]|nr:recombinase family protein [Negativicutes bacterium]